MAVRIYKNLHGVLLNVDAVNQSWKEGIQRLLLMREKEYEPQSQWAKLKDFWKSKRTIQFENFDSKIIEENRIPVGQEGCDGNLYYFAHKDEHVVQNLIDFFEENGLNSQDDYYRIHPITAYAKNRHPRTWVTKVFATEPISIDSLRADFVVYSYNPYSSPYVPKKFPYTQGDITYDTKYIWSVCQKALKEDTPEIMFDLLFLQERYLNASLWEKHLPPLDDFIKTYLSGEEHIPHEYLYIVDGSKVKKDFLSKIYTFEEEPSDNVD